jgi:hypothetical protein
MNGQKYTGHSTWARWPKQLSGEAVYQPSDTLSLSPSSLNTYMQCPRKFFYQKTLGLRGESSEEASMGTLIHRLMEVFNKTLNSPQDHTLDRLMGWVETLFAPENFSTLPPLNPENRDIHQQGSLPEAFQNKDLLPLKNLTLLARSELKDRVVSALEDLSAKGYFQKPFLSIHSEYGFGPDAKITGLENCSFSARVDAIIQRSASLWEIVDYKFYGPNQFKILEEDKLKKRLLSALEPLPEGNLSHSERFKMTEASPRDQQLILYYCLSQETLEFKGKVDQVSLQIIRPPFPNQPQQGSIHIGISRDEIERGLPQWKADLQRYVIDPIRTQDTFDVNPGRHCQYCSYVSICETTQGFKDPDEGDIPSEETILEGGQRA